MLERFSKQPFCQAYLCYTLMDARDSGSGKRLKYLGRVQSLITLIKSNMSDNHDKEEKIYKHRISLWLGRLTPLIESIKPLEGEEACSYMINLVDSNIKDMIGRSWEEALKQAR